MNEIHLVHFLFIYLFIYLFCQWEPDEEEGLRRGAFNSNEKNSLTRQLCITLMALTDKVGRFESDQIALKLVERYPFLKGSFGMGHAMHVI